MNILSLEDKEYLQAIMEEMLEPMIDDYCLKEFHPSLAEFILSMGDCFCIEPEEGIIFMLTTRTMTLTEVHMLVTKDKRGKQAVEAAHKGIAWLFKNTTCEKLFGMVPRYNKAALIFSKQVGFNKEGICKKSIRKNNQLHDQIIFGLEKEEFLCPQQ